MKVDWKPSKIIQSKLCYHPMIQSNLEHGGPWRSPSGLVAWSCVDEDSSFACEASNCLSRSCAKDMCATAHEKGPSIGRTEYTSTRVSKGTVYIYIYIYRYIYIWLWAINRIFWRRTVYKIIFKQHSNHLKWHLTDL